MGTEQNLKPFEKGCKGGPGRPKGKKNTATIIKKFMKAKMDVQKNPITNRPGKLSMQEMMVLAMMKKATSGDVRAFDTLIDRLDGKVPTPMRAEVGDMPAGTSGILMLRWENENDIKWHDDPKPEPPQGEQVCLPPE